MRNFWLGVLIGVTGTFTACAILGVAFNVVTVQRARAAFQNGEPPPALIVVRGLFGSRGEFGTIDAIENQTMTLAARDGSKKIILVADDTDIYKGPLKIPFSDLRQGQRVVVVAAPQGDGTLKAKLIRLVSSSFYVPRYPGEG